MEHNTVCDAEETEKKINENLTTVVSENKQDDEVIDETIDSGSDEDTDTEPEENFVVYFDALTIPGLKTRLLLILQNFNWIMNYLIIRLFILLDTMN